MHITRTRVLQAESRSSQACAYWHEPPTMRPCHARHGLCATGRIHDSPREVQISASHVALRTMRLRPGTYVATPPRSHTQFCDYQQHSSEGRSEPAGHECAGPRGASGQHGRLHSRLRRRRELSADPQPRGHLCGGPVTPSSPLRVRLPWCQHSHCAQRAAAAVSDEEQ